MAFPGGRPDPGGRLADLLLEREAALIRVGHSPVPHDFAGLVISDEEVDALLSGADRDRQDGAQDLAGTSEAAVWDAAIDEARDYFAVTLDQTGLGRVARTARLDPIASEVLAVLVAVELDVRRQRLAAYVQNDVGRPRLTLALIGRLFGSPGLDAVGPAGPLASAGLIRVGGDSPWSASQVAPLAALCWVMTGGSGAGGSGPGASGAGGPGAGAAGPGADWSGADRSGAVWSTAAVPDLPDDVIDLDLDIDLDLGVDSRAPEAPGPAILLVSGGDRARRRQASGGVGRGRLTVSLRPETTAGWEALIGYATVTGRAPLLETDTLTASDRRWLEQAAHLTWIISSDRELPLDCLPRRPWSELDAGDHPLASDREWQSLAGMPRPAGVRLTRTQLELVAPLIKGRPPALPAALRRLTTGHLDRLTRRTRPRRSWDDLVVGEEQHDGLRLLCARWRHRDQVFDDWGFPAIPSAGVVALFSGPSGTGKTLAAEVVAADLGLDLYRLDISTVVSKYIGETEKHLEEVFSAAATGEVVLFFDEADALFGKRSEVSDAHDRYANIEVAYLLQRLEEHDGLVVLATNLQQNIDPAFLRRIDVLVSFPVPDRTQRRAIWQRVFGASAPVEALDLDWMATRFELTGAEIRNVALEAAFRAATTGGPISMAHLMAATRREMRKAGRLCDPDDFATWLPRPEETWDAAAAR